MPEQISGEGSIGMEMWFTVDGPRIPSVFKDIVVESAGFETSGGTSSVTVGGVTVGSIARGLNVIVLDQNDGSVLETATYDTHATQESANSFAALVESLPDGRLVAVSVNDDASRQLTDRAKRAFASLGGGIAASNILDRQSWAFIGRKGYSPNMTASAIVDSNDPKKEKSAPARAVHRLVPDSCLDGVQSFTLSMQSAGFQLGSVNIAIDGEEVTIPNARGLNVAVIDARSGVVTSTHVFDTHNDTNDDNVAGDNFAKLIENLDRFTLVAIVVKDDASHNLNERAKRALRSLGSLLVDRLSYRASWALCGNVGFAPGSCLETLLINGPVSISTRVPKGPPETRTPRRSLLAALLFASAGAAVMSVISHLYMYSQTNTPDSMVMRPAQVPPPSDHVKRRALLVSARTPSFSQAELPERSDKILASHRRNLVNAK